ncbi:CX module domain-containing protein [Ditylenchus destructor]|uniref:CX module domain-containing protein n=1 Tax=Ditylenchus destructor TaxID=166010 RepID=A0AAD4R512_9BILA|nr:CX module domain-containing protein [Ditylenchus destructor]
MWKTVCVLFLVAYSPVSDARKGSGGGGGMRGGNGPVRQGPPPGGFGGGPQQGGFGQPRPNGGFGQPHGPPPGGFGGAPGGHMGGGGFNQPGGFNRGGFQGGHSSFGGGSGPGSMSRGSVFKTALAGAALGTVGGLVTYELGKAILHSSHQPFQYDNRNYYFDQQNYKGRPGEIMCSMPLQQLINTNAAVTTTTQAPPAADQTTPSPNGPTTTPTPDQLLQQVVYPNGTRPKDIVWSCKQGTEICCGTDCCPAPAGQAGQYPPTAGAEKRSGSGFGTIIFVIIVALLLSCCCCALVAYKFCRSAFDFVMPSSQNSQQQYSNNNPNTYYDDPNKYQQGAYGQQQPQQSYPMQPYPQQGYQQGYAPPPQYPAYPQQKY